MVGFNYLDGKNNGNSFKIRKDIYNFFQAQLCTQKILQFEAKEYDMLCVAYFDDFSDTLDISMAFPLCDSHSFAPLFKIKNGKKYDKNIVKNILSL